MKALELGKLYNFNYKLSVLL